MENFVITVNRQYASRGREVARRLSELLNIRCYDEELIEEAAEELELPEEIVGTEEETAVRKPLPVTRIPIILGKGSSHTQDDIFDAQASFMNKIVKEESCIIVGRCSDYILSDHKNALWGRRFSPSSRERPGLWGAPSARRWRRRPPGRGTGMCWAVCSTRCCCTSR